MTGKIFLSFVSLLALAHDAFADARHFTYVYETAPSSPGEVEIENWVTWKSVDGSDRIDFRHELEFGITRHLQAAIYLADWNYHDGSSERASGFSYNASSIELIYNLTNPVADRLGLSIYQEYKVGDRIFEWESKVIAQKNFGPLIIAYNATLEAVWEGEDLDQREGEIQQSAGVSYEWSPRFSTGAEFVHELVFPDWRGKREMNFFVGPNASFRAGDWWTTITALAKGVGGDEEPDLQVRAIVGHEF